MSLLHNSFFWWRAQFMLRGLLDWHLSCLSSPWEQKLVYFNLHHQFRSMIIYLSVISKNSIITCWINWQTSLSAYEFICKKPFWIDNYSYLFFKCLYKSFSSPIMNCSENKSSHSLHYIYNIIMHYNKFFIKPFG